MSERFNSTKFLLVLGLFIFVAGLLLINTCKRIYLDPNEFAEGIIQYKISYPELDSSHLFHPFLPHSMSIKVKGKRIKVETKAGLGLFQTVLIGDLRKKEGINLLKLINVRYKTTMDEAFYDAENETDKRSMRALDSLANYLGEEVAFAEVRYPWTVKPDTIMFTKHLYADNLNFHNGFSETNRILLHYKQRFQGVLMEFKATEIRETSVSKYEFKIEDDFKEISRLSFLKELNKTMSPLRN